MCVSMSPSLKKNCSHSELMARIQGPLTYSISHPVITQGFQVVSKSNR